MGQFECRNLKPMVESVQTLSRIGGVNVWGAERFRLVWGWDVRDFTGKNLFFRYDIPERWLERFHLEYWVPPVTYGSPEAWTYNNLDEVVGPYPRGGGYERVITFEHGQTHRFIEPTPLLVTEAVGLFRRSEKPSDDKIAKNIREMRETKKTLARQRKHDVIDENISAFGLSPWMPVSGPLTPVRRRTDWRNNL